AGSVPPPTQCPNSSSAHRRCNQPEAIGQAAPRGAVQHRADPGHGLHKPSLRRLLGSADAPSARKRKSSRDPNSDREPNPRSLVRPLRQQALCYHHHRLVHEGGWQVIRAGEGVKFITPPHLWGGGAKRRWASAGQLSGDKPPSALSFRRQGGRDTTPSRAAAAGAGPRSTSAPATAGCPPVIPASARNR